MDYEYLILNNSDENAIIDECASCPYKGQCNNQCMQIEAVYNPYINKEQEVRRWRAALHYQLASQLYISLCKLNYKKPIGGFK